MERTAGTVYGEPVGDVLPGLVALADSMRPGPDGMYRGSVTLEHATAAPLFRALMRAEAELMLEDADSYGTADAQKRTHEQRAADAVFRLASRLRDDCN